MRGRDASHITSNDAARTPFDIVLNGAGGTPTQSQSVTAASGFPIWATAGSGDFGSAATFAGADNPVTVVTADLNADGRQDVVTTNILGDTVAVYLGNGDGTLAAKTTYATGKAPFGLAVEDVNSDGRPDLVVTATTPTPCPSC